MTPITAEKALYDDLLSIYARTGAEVSYETDRGERKAYWPKRFLQAVKKYGEEEDLSELLRRFVSTERPTRGFYILKNAGRLDLTVEALVIDEEKPYHASIDPELVERARRRLTEHESDEAAGAQEAEPDLEETAETLSRVLKPGETFDVRVRVGNDGSLSLALV